MVEPAKYKLTFWKGATFSKTLEMRDEDGDLFNFTGYTGILKIQPSPTDLTNLLTLTDGSGITFGPDPGEIQLFVSAGATGAFAWTHGYYTFRITSPANNTDIILFGGAAVKS
jgi:hypothetical protein